MHLAFWSFLMGVTHCMKPERLVMCSFKNYSDTEFKLPEGTLSVRLYFPKSGLLRMKGQACLMAHAKLPAPISLLSQMVAFHEPLVLVAFQGLQVEEYKNIFYAVLEEYILRGFLAIVGSLMLTIQVALAGIQITFLPQGVRAEEVWWNSVGKGSRSLREGQGGREDTDEVLVLARSALGGM